MSIKNMDSIYELFKKSEEFPVDECVINESEEDIFSSNKFYLCLIVDKRFDNEVCIKIMQPYIWKENDLVLYGWVDKHSNYVDNMYKPIHDDDEVVIGFIENMEDKNGDWHKKFVKSIIENRTTL